MDAPTYDSFDKKSEIFVFKPPITKNCDIKFFLAKQSSKENYEIIDTFATNINEFDKNILVKFNSKLSLGKQ